MIPRYTHHNVETLCTGICRGSQNSGIIFISSSDSYSTPIEPVGILHTKAVAVGVRLAAVQADRWFWCPACRDARLGRLDKSRGVESITYCQVGK